MRNAGDRAAPGGRAPGTPRDAGAGGRHTGSSGRSRDAAEHAPPSPGGASLFTPAYRVSHADLSGQPGVGHAGPAGYGDAAYGYPARDGAGYPWTGDEQGQTRGGYGRAGYHEGSYGGADHGRPGYAAAADGPAWPEDELGSPYSWSTGDPDAWPGTSLPDASAQRMMSNAVRGFPPAPDDPLPVYPPGPFAAWNRGQAGRQDGRDGRAGRAGGLADRSQLAIATITPDEFDTDYSLPAIKDPLPGQTERAVRPDSRRAAASGSGPAQRVVRGDQRAPDAGGTGRGGGAKGRSGRAGARARKKRQPAWLAIGAAGVIIAAVAGVLVITTPRGTAPPQRHVRSSSTPAPTSASPTPPPGPWGYIGSRATDSVPLTETELYPAKISHHGVVYTRVRQAKGTNCRPALIGSALRAAVERGGCDQTLRATYLSKAAKVMGTIGVFNLTSAAKATKAAGEAGHTEFVAQLAAKSGPAKAIGHGTGIEEAIVKGHYLVLVWAEKTNLSPPKTKAGRAKLTAFMNLLVDRTVNLSLSSRMVDGKPALPG